MVPVRRPILPASDAGFGRSKLGWWRWGEIPALVHCVQNLVIAYAPLGAHGHVQAGMHSETADPVPASPPITLRKPWPNQYEVNQYILLKMPENIKKHKSSSPHSRSRCCLYYIKELLRTYWNVIKQRMTEEDCSYQQQSRFMLIVEYYWSYFRPEGDTLAKNTDPLCVVIIF